MSNSNTKSKVWGIDPLNSVDQVDDCGDLLAQVAGLADDLDELGWEVWLLPDDPPMLIIKKIGEKGEGKILDHAR